MPQDDYGDYQPVIFTGSIGAQLLDGDAADGGNDDFELLDGDEAGGRLLLSGDAI